MARDAGTFKYWSKCEQIGNIEDTSRRSGTFKYWSKGEVNGVTYVVDESAPPSAIGGGGPYPAWWINNTEIIGAGNP